MIKHYFLLGFCLRKSLPDREKIVIKIETDAEETGRILRYVHLSNSCSESRHKRQVCCSWTSQDSCHIPTLTTSVVLLQPLCKVKSSRHVRECKSILILPQDGITTVIRDCVYFVNSLLNMSG